MRHHFRFDVHKQWRQDLGLLRTVVRDDGNFSASHWAQPAEVDRHNTERDDRKGMAFNAR